MKKLHFWSLMLGLVFGSLAFVACGDDDDDNSNSGGGASGDLATQIIGKWYVTEVSQDKVLVDIIEFKADKTGTFTEYKAKAKYNWQLEGGEDPFNYTISGKRVIMTITSGEKAGQKREGDVVMNSDGTATVTTNTDEGTNTMLLRRVTNQTGESLMQELLKDKEVKINSDIVGSWTWGQPDMPEGEQEHHVAGYVFKASGECYYYENDYEFNENGQQMLMFEETKLGSYTIDGTKLKMNWTSGSRYDGGSGTKHELDEEELGIDEAEVTISSSDKYDIMILRRYYEVQGRQGYSEEGPFYKAK